MQSEPPNTRAIWPTEGLEDIGHCPICGDVKRNLLYSDLSDRIFFIAPGTWTMWQCTSCRTGYLDPRPSKSTIGLAYGRYYTHKRADVLPGKSVLERFRQALGNDYRKARYKARLIPILPFVGRVAIKLLPKVRRRIDFEYRFLPRLSQGSSLLDVGSGNGDFLRTASGAGWEVAGVEPDPKARKLASAEGVDVRETLQDWAEHSGSFHYVTASHVIEHVHDPVEFLSMIRNLIAPGGRLYLQTPNIDAPTHLRFGPYWRGLEPPRHLVIFNRQSLADALTNAGFESPSLLRYPEAEDLLVKPSIRIANGLDPYTGERISAAPPTNTQGIDGAFSEPVDDFLTMIAKKPR